MRSLLRLLPYVRPVGLPLIATGLCALAATLAGLTIPLVMQRIIDGPIAESDLSGLVWMTGVVVLLGCAEALLIYLRRRLISGPTTGIEATMRRDLYHHLQRLPASFHDQWSSGQLLSRAVSDLAQVRRFLAFIGIYLVVNTITIIVGLGVLFVLAPFFGIVLLAAGIPVAVLCARYEAQYSISSRRSQDQTGDLATTIEESVLGVRVLKAFGRGPHLGRRFAEQARALRTTELRKVRIMSRLWLVVIALPETGIAVMIALGGLAVANGSLTLGALVAAVTTATVLRWPIESMGWLLTETSQTATAADRYWEVRDAVRTVDEPARPATLPADARGELRFEQVRFAYSAADDGPGRSAAVDGSKIDGPAAHPSGTTSAAAPTTVLRGIDLVVRPGETLALVGGTGSGKTTLTTLPSRLYDVTDGRVLLDGVDVRDLPLSLLRTRVATAFEDPVLFSMSVRENVTLGAPQASEQDIVAALRVAHALDFVEALPWGLDTRIGEEGLSLSGGQRQRLALARAVVGRPSVLVMDDPLSALDVHTEAEVEAALRQVLRDVTALVVAHRPSTVALADRVALLVDGRIEAVGTHHELLAASAEYRRMLSTLDEEVAPASGPASGAVDGLTTVLGDGAGGTAEPAGVTSAPQAAPTGNGGTRTHRRRAHLERADGEQTATNEGMRAR
ncbi:ATP-binding cassette subfamily B protein [Actinoalloteichus hoggarensis]|uniref:ABC transporter ATP-binding protein n=1 Tax=Actinoalloteichus hoggarensis TaxID=1470176 RepID=UPI0017F502CC|nr:ABC transporter ATP-binding protein [Actinoalloteichus hoggarensis]MBB5924035.1 ATP-binding cassette subfamily B protein [Actinoalloteichus hoggarensis]